MKTKFKYSIYLLLFAIHLNAQTFVWKNSIGTIGNEYSRLSKDTIGNFYLFGVAGSGLSSNGYLYFQNDSVQFYGNGGDMYVAKVNSNGNIQWAVTYGSRINNTLNEGTSVNYNKYDNNIYLSGFFTDGDVHFGNTVFSNGPGIFLSKMDVNGNFYWTKLYSSKLNNCAFNNQGDLYFNGPDSSQGNWNITKIDTSGNLRWTKSVINYPNGYLARLLYEEDNNDFVITGGIKNNSYLDTSLINSNDSNNYFISRFDTSGNILSYFSIGSPNNLIELKSKLSENNIISVLRYTDTINLQNESHYATGDAYLITKHDLNGQIMWAKRIDAVGYFLLYSIEYTPGSIYITGSFDNNFLFDSTEVFTTNSPYPGSGFIIYLDENGNYKDSYTFPKSEITGILRSNDGKVVITGEFRDTLQLGSNQLTSYGLTDGFIAKMDSLNSIGETERSSNNNLIIYANPNTGSCRLVIPDEIKNTENLLLVITDSGGKTIYSGKPEEIGSELFINLEQFASGQYFVLLRNGSKDYHGKIIFNK